MPYCGRCGIDINKDNKFCPQCGTLLNACEKIQSGNKQLDRNQIALIQYEIQQCRLTEIFAIIGLGGGIAATYLGFSVMDYPLVAQIGLGLAALCLILFPYYYNKEQKLVKKLKD
jgi:hypothetical protein